MVDHMSRLADFWNRWNKVGPWGGGDNGVGYPEESGEHIWDDGFGRSSVSKIGTKTHNISFLRGGLDSTDMGCFPQDRGYQPYRLSLMSHAANPGLRSVAKVSMASAAR